MLGNNEMFELERDHMFELEQEQTSATAQVTYLVLAAAAGAGLGFGVQALWKKYHTPSEKEIAAMKEGLEKAIVAAASKAAANAKAEAAKAATTK